MNSSLFKMLLIFLCLLFHLNSEAQSEISDIAVLNFMQLEPMLHQSNDTTYVVNFWATWCIPCRKELPDFEKIHALSAKGQKIKVLLVSLDFVSKIETSVIPFLKKNNITAEVIVLNDPDSNSWINKVDASWSGALPATIIYNNKERTFLERELTFEEINQLINNIN